MKTLSKRLIIATIFFILIIFLYFKNTKSPENIRNLDSLTTEEYYSIGFSSIKKGVDAKKTIFDLEKNINSIYKKLNQDILPYTKKKSTSFFDEMFLRFIIDEASDSLFDVEKNFLLSSGVPVEKISRDLLGKVSVFSSEAVVLPSENFLHFLHGASDAAGYYITAFPQKSEFNGTFSVTFPKFCFADPAFQENVPLPEEVKYFLKSNFFLNGDARNLYHSDKNNYTKITVEKSREYSMDGLRPTCGIYGELDKRLPQQKIILFSDVIKNEGHLKKHPELTADFFKEIEIHELMHYLTKNTCDRMGFQDEKIGNIAISKRKINEALASIATVAITTSALQENRVQTLLNNFYFSKEKDYRLTFDIFFSNVFLKTSKEKFNQLEQAVMNGKILTSKELPSYMKAMDIPSNDIIGQLMIDGKIRYITIPVDYDNFRFQYDLLTEASDKTILSAAEIALTTLKNIQNSACFE